MAEKLGTAQVETGSTSNRNHELRGILENRRQQLLRDLDGRLRGVRAELGRRPHEGQDFGEVAEIERDDDIQFALLQMKTETLHKIEDALARLDQGRYGTCHECGDEIASARLRALPFAVRCTDCESDREQEAARVQALARRSTPLFAVYG